MSTPVVSTRFEQLLDSCYEKQPFGFAQKMEILRAFSVQKDCANLKAVAQKVDDLILRLEIFSAEVHDLYQKDQLLKLDKVALKEQLDAKQREVYGLKQKLVDTQLLQSFQSGRTLKLLKTDMTQVNEQLSRTSAADREADTELMILEEAYQHADDPLYTPLRYKVLEEAGHKINVLKTIREHCLVQLQINA